MALRALSLSRFILLRARIAAARYTHGVAPGPLGAQEAREYMKAALKALISRTL